MSFPGWRGKESAVEKKSEAANRICMAKEKDTPMVCKCETSVNERSGDKKVVNLNILVLFIVIAS